MTNEEIGRVGVASLIAALGAVVQAQLDYCDGAEAYRSTVLWWLLMIAACGVILDAARGSKRAVLLVSSMISGSVFVGAGFFMSIVDTSGNFCFSAVTENHPAIVPLVLVVWVTTGLSIFVLSFSSPMIRKAVIVASRDGTAERAANIEKTIRAVLAALAATALVLGIV